MNKQNNSIVPLQQLITTFLEKPDVFIGNIIKTFMNDDFFKNFKFGANVLQNNVKEDSGNYVVKLDLKGFNKEQIKIKTDKDNLIVRAFRRDDYRREHRGNVTRKSAIGQFERSYSLEGIDRKNIKAVLKDGILKITMPKKRRV